jgi:porphobilinogen synthase
MTSRVTGFVRPQNRLAHGEPPVEARSLDLTHRPRRNRKAEWARRLVRETRLTTDDLIWPLFIVEGDGVRHPIPSMPAVERLGIDQAVAEAQRAVDLGIPAIALFPYTDPALRDARGSEALSNQNLVCRACRAIKAAVPQIGLYRPWP